MTTNINELETHILELTDRSSNLEKAMHLNKCENSNLRAQIKELELIFSHENVEAETDESKDLSPRITGDENIAKHFNEKYKKLLKKVQSSDRVASTERERCSELEAEIAAISKYNIIISNYNINF